MVSPTAKRRRRKRLEEDNDPEFQVAPMVDVLLVLMLFFMSITSTEMLKKEKNLHLPDADQAQQDKNRKNKVNELIVNVSWDNDTAGFSMDGIKYPTAESLENILASDHQQNPHAYVLIRADRNVEYSNISDVMNACAAVGIGTVSFAVISGGDKQKTPASTKSTASN